jgi:hypothetical protein
MNGAASLRIFLRVFLALFVFALTLATLTRPLNRAKFNFAPELGQLHQGLSRHTFLEVPASSPDVAPAFTFFATDHLRLPTNAYERTFEIGSARQPENWPIVFSGIYRHVPPSKPADPDPSA